MRSILKDHFFRWLIPIILTLVLLPLLWHKSSDQQLFSRYSYTFFLLLLVMGIWALISWSIVLDQARYRRFSRRLHQLPLFYFVVLVGGTFTVFDFFLDHSITHVVRLAPVSSLVPMIPIVLMIAMWLLSTDNPRESTHRLSLLIISTIIGLYISEGFFRLVLLEHKVPVTEAGFTKWITSSWPRHIPVEKRPNTYRILGLSDSFGRAGGFVNYHYLLETLLRNKGLDLEIVNISLGECELPDELDLFRYFGSRYQSDLILHGVFVGNDFFVPEGTLMSYHGISVRSSKLGIPYLPHNFLLRDWLRNYMRILYDRRLRQAEADRNESTGTFSEELFLQIEQQRLNICRIKPDMNIRWQKVTELLDKIRKEVNQMGAKYVMVIHPDQFQVDNKLLHQIEKRYNLNLDYYEFDLPQRFLKDYCASRGVQCLDLLPIFRLDGAERSLYQFRNTHYNKDGNLLAANAISNFLQEQDNLIPKNTNL